MEFIPAALPTLRLLRVHIDAKGRDVVEDSPVVCWAIDARSGCLTPVGIHPPSDGHTFYLRDDVAKTWTDVQTGHSFSEWKAVLAPLFAAHDAKPAEAPTPALTTPSVGAPVDTWTKAPAHRLHDKEHPRDRMNRSG